MHSAGTVELYFAYGSNMNAAVLAQRLGRPDPSGFRRRRALLRNHKLLFNKMSSMDASVGYGNVTAAAGHCVEGTLNELTRDELVRLDAVELVPHHYVRSALPVHDCRTGTTVVAHVYTAHPAWVRPALAPLRSYVERLLDGADLLSADYVAPLRALQCRD
jgi:gamma-glutamylcyclotransferase